MQRFTRNERTGAVEASEGHDDCVAAEWLVRDAIPRVREMAPELPRARAPVDPLERYLLRERVTDDGEIGDRDLGQGW
jgi:hypothetical protein